jgi:hypothetical protein
VVELAPAVLPVVVDLRHTGFRELGEDAPGRLAVGRELDAAAVLALLEALGGEIEEARAELLGPV